MGGALDGPTVRVRQCPGHRPPLAAPSLDWRPDRHRRRGDLCGDVQRRPHALQGRWRDLDHARAQRQVPAWAGARPAQPRRPVRGVIQRRRVGHHDRARRRHLHEAGWTADHAGGARAGRRCALARRRAERRVEGDRERVVAHLEPRPYSAAPAGRYRHEVAVDDRLQACFRPGGALHRQCQRHRRAYGRPDQHDLPFDGRRDDVEVGHCRPSEDLVQRQQRQRDLVVARRERQLRTGPRSGRRLADRDRSEQPEPHLLPRPLGGVEVG